MTVVDPESELDKEILAEAGWIRHLARRLLRDEGAAADLTQDVLASAIEQRPRLGSRLRAWLRGTTLRLAARRHRERSRRRKHEARAAKPAAGNPEEEAVERVRLHRRLTDAVLALPEPYRSVVIARFFDGLPHREIARRRDVSHAAVRQQLHRAMAMLRARLDEEFGSRKAWSAAVVSLLGDPLAAVATVVAGAYAMKKIAIAVVTVLLLVLAYQSVMPSSTMPGRDLAPEGRGMATGTETAEHTAVPPERVALEDGVARASLSLSVVDGRGVPVAGASTWVWTPGGAPHRKTVDAVGQVSFSGRAEPGQVLALAEGRVPRELELPELLGRHEVVLEPGEVLQGWAVVDGAVPVHPIALEVRTREPILPEELPEAVREELTELGIGDLFHVTTGEGGAFRVAGLPPDWSGSVRVPLTEPYWIRQVTTERMQVRSLNLARPQSGLRLELVELPVVEGQAIWADTLEPISRGELSMMVSASVPGGSDVSGDGFTMRADGLFRHGIWLQNRVDPMVWMDPERRPPIERIRISIGAKGATGQKVVELDVSGLQPPFDVGTIAVERAELRHVVVRDRGGRPVPGAVVQAEGMSEPTDAQGRTTLRIFEERDCRVGAIGYRIGLLEPESGSGTPEDPLVFVLEPGNLLVLRVVDEDGRVPPVEKLRLSWEGAYLLSGTEDRRGFPSGVHRALSDAIQFEFGFSMHQGVPVDGWAGISLDAKGTATIPGLTPHTDLTLQVLGALGDVAFEQHVEAPGPREHKEVELVFAGEGSFSIGGNVLDERGYPLAGARVRAAGSYQSTGEDGWFEFGPIHVEQEYEIQVTHEGLAPVELTGVTLGPRTRPLEIRMELGYDVTVKAVDHTGAVVPVGSIDYDGRSESMALRMTQTRREPGVHAFEDLAAGRKVFWCKVMGERYETAYEVGTGGGEVHIEVPEMGELLVPVTDQSASALRDERSIYLHVRVRSVEDPELALEDHYWADAPRFLLPPGQYQVRLDEVQREGQKEFGRRTVKGPIEVTIRARELVTLDLR